MTGLSRVFDASRPPLTAPAGFAGVLGYIGRPKFTPHVWTIAEWERFTKLVKFPAWVPDLAVHAGDEAAAITAALDELGFGGKTGTVVIDYETAGAAEAAWHSHLAQALGHKGYAAMAYGSLSTVMGIGASEVWVADYDGNAVLEPAGMTVHAHQFRANVPYAGTELDYSVADAWLMARGFRG